MDHTGGVLGRNETERLAVAEFAELANMPHRPIYEGAMYRPSAEQVCAQYAENPVFEAGFEGIEETFITSNGAVRQIAIILAPDVEDVKSGKKFRMKIGNKADAVSVPLYLAMVKDVKRVASSTGWWQEREAPSVVGILHAHEPDEKGWRGSCIGGDHSRTKHILGYRYHPPTS